MDDLELALELGVDFVALSFVRSAADVRDLRALIEQAGSHAHVIAKIEKAEAVDALEEILEETDAVMVARGDLGVEIGVALVPLLQKRIITAALERGKPVITATQMLESMVHQAEPTRAEASDVANAILDGTSALMLSGETAVGEYPVESVAYMDRIARAVEPSLGYRHELPERADEPTVGQAMSNAACDLAEALRAKAILVPTYTGRTASVVARLRPRRPIIALTQHDYALRQMAIEWGVSAFLIPECDDVDTLLAASCEAAKKSGLVDEGDRVVITAGTAVNLPGTTDLIKVDACRRPGPPRRIASRGQALPQTASSLPLPAALGRPRRDRARRPPLRAAAAAATSTPSTTSRAAPPTSVRCGPRSATCSTGWPSRAPARR